MNIPLYAPGERIRRLGEACALIKLLFTQPVADYEGRYYQLRAARCEPKPVQRPYPPFVIGGSGEQLTLRVAAQHADIWNFNGGPVEIFTRKVGILHEHCAAVGRDPATIALSVQLVVDNGDLAAVGPALQRYVDAGATHFVFNLRPPYTAEVVARLADEIIPRVRA